jgi:hypothetical protein
VVLPRDDFFIAHGRDFFVLSTFVQRFSKTWRGSKVPIFQGIRRQFHLHHSGRKQRASPVVSFPKQAQLGKEFVWNRHASSRHKGQKPQAGQHDTSAQRNR